MLKGILANLASQADRIQNEVRLKQPSVFPSTGFWTLLLFNSFSVDHRPESCGESFALLFVAGHAKTAAYLDL